MGQDSGPTEQSLQPCPRELGSAPRKLVCPTAEKGLWARAIPGRALAAHPQGHGLHPGPWEAVTGILGTSLTRASKSGPCFKVTLFLCCLFGTIRSLPLQLSQPRWAEDVSHAENRAGCISTESQPLGSSSSLPCSSAAPGEVSTNYNHCPGSMLHTAPAMYQAIKQGQSGRCPCAGGNRQPYAVEEPECQP